jgi:hypothetical protein
MADIMYHLNGSGRDTYIFNNNGGFSITNDRNVFAKSGKFLPKPHASSPGKFPSLA